jgi:hypothetical protein
MSDNIKGYTPTTDEVRDGFRGNPKKYDEAGTPVERMGENYAVLNDMAFNRWLAAHDAQIRADALNGLKPDDGGWYPNDGAVVVNGKLYFEADYMLTREDIQRIRADTWDEGFTEGRDLAVSGQPMTRNNPYREQKQ